MDFLETTLMMCSITNSRQVGRHPLGTESADRKAVHGQTTNFSSNLFTHWAIHLLQGRGTVVLWLMTFEVCWVFPRETKYWGSPRWNVLEEIRWRNQEVRAADEQLHQHDSLDPVSPSRLGRSYTGFTQSVFLLPLIVPGSVPSSFIYVTSF